MRKKYIALLIICLLVIACISITSKNYAAKFEMNDFNYVTPQDGKYGQLKYELNFENVVNKLSSDVIIGEVIASNPYTDSHNMFDVKIEEVLVGNESNKEVKVYAHRLSLELGNKYVLFLRNHDSSLYEYPFYVLLNEFVMKIDNNGQVLLLENPETKKFIKPFKDNKNNELSKIKEYINRIKKDNIFAHKVKQVVIDEVTDIKELADISNHVLEIKVTDVNIAGIKENIAIADFDIIKAYKGGKFENVHKLLLPSSVEANNNYLVFLIDDDESVTPTTRKGSVLKAGTEEYEKAVKILEQ